MDYSARKIASVKIWDLQGITMNADDAPGIRGFVGIKLTAFDGGPNGPSVTLDVASPLDLRERTVRDAEQALLATAVGVLARLSQENAQALEAVRSPNPSLIKA